MTTALELVRQTLRSIGLPDVDTLVGGSSSGEKALVHMNRGGQAMLGLRSSYTESWPEANRRYVFSADGTLSFYALPSDYTTIIKGTFWDISAGWENRGSLSPADDSLVRQGHWYNPIGETLYREETQNGVRGVSLYPTPAAGARFQVEYVSNNWVKVSPTAPPTKPAVDRDTDVPIFPPHLTVLDLAWRLKAADDEPHDTELGEFTRELDRQFGLYAPAGPIVHNGDAGTDLLSEPGLIVRVDGDTGGGGSGGNEPVDLDLTEQGGVLRLRVGDQTRELDIRELLRDVGVPFRG